MLTHLSVQNFTLVEHLDLDIEPGMTAITGETGAGKSVLLDALGLTLGDKADGGRVRLGCTRADVAARFDVSKIQAAQNWLQQHDLDNGDECLLRRVVTPEGRSRGHINGQAATLTQLRELGEMLIDIHSQHEHQSLLKKDTHRKLLDDFSGNNTLVRRVQDTFRDWHKAKMHFIEVRDSAHDASARLQLLSYQSQELEQLQLQEDELQQLEQEQKQLANAETLLQGGQQVSEICAADSGGLLSELGRALHLLRDLDSKGDDLNEAEQLLLSAQIQIEEANRGLDQYCSSFQADPARLLDVEARLSSIYQIARKHRIAPEQLCEFHQQLSAELEQINGGDAQLEALELKAQKLKTSFLIEAKKLGKKRRNAAEKLQKNVNQQLHDLAMPCARLSIVFHDCSSKASIHGLEETEFLISTNPGQPPAPLHKVASGGELSRISLAIQVVTARTSTTPTLVFDEVDVGIGGATADIVGKLLRQLGEEGGQVICVTHLAQVASKGHNHLLASKTTSSQKAESTLLTLEGDNKIEEIARMLGGENITQQTRAHAREVLEGAA